MILTIFFLSITYIPCLKLNGKYLPTGIINERNKQFLVKNYNNFRRFYNTIIPILGCCIIEISALESGKQNRPLIC